MKLRFYREYQGGRARCRVEADAELQPLFDFLETEVGPDADFCNDVLARTRDASQYDEWIEVGYWNVTAVSVSGQRVRIESDIVDGSACEISLGAFGEALSEWGRFIRGRAEPGWRSFPQV